MSSGTAWFNDAKFGIFVHWGLYSIWGRGEWVLFKEKIPKAEYNRLVEQFQPGKFHADDWANLAVRAGAKYMVFTTRHHDGFAMYDSKASDFNSVKTAAGRDFVREFVDACRRAGLRIGLYHSVMSWQWPAIFTGPAADPDGWAAMVEESHAQVRELMGNYGKIDMLWYDGAVVPGMQDDGMQAKHWRSRELNAMVRRLQPDILINDRSGLPEDFVTPEQHVTAPPAGRRWEACMTLNGSWGYNASDRNFKTPREVVDCLIYAARFGGNLLLNVGPRADGSIQAEARNRLETVGKWLAANGEAIYGARRNAYSETSHACAPATRKGKRAFFFLSGNTGKTIRIDGLGRDAEACILTRDSTLKIDTKTDKTIDVSGLPKLSSGALPLVLAITAKTFGVPAHTLGHAKSHIRLPPGDVPVLGEDGDRFSPPEPPVIDGQPLKRLFSSSRGVVGADSSQWCPGWSGRTVFSSSRHPFPVLNLDVPVDGSYDIALGLMAKSSTPLEIRLDDVLVPSARRLRYGACPDTIVLERQHLAQGRHALSITSKVALGVYALKLTPHWKPLPSESWWTVGPFPTAFGPQAPICEVRKAMSAIFPPEKGRFDVKDVYPGIGSDEVRWSHSKVREGEHSGLGVDFPYRCGSKHSGVCYARTSIVSPEARKALLLIGCDWWANAWLNGRPVASQRPAAAAAEDGSQFNGWKPMPAEIHLKKGSNTLLVKCHRGSCANWFTCLINDAPDLEVKPEK